MNYSRLLNTLFTTPIPYGSIPVDIFYQFLNLLRSSQDPITLVAAIIPSVLALIRLFISLENSRKKKAHSKPSEITVIINGNPITIEGGDFDTTIKLAERFQQLHPKVETQVKKRKLKKR